MGLSIFNTASLSFLLSFLLFSPFSSLFIAAVFPKSRAALLLSEFLSPPLLLVAAWQWPDSSWGRLGSRKGRTPRDQDRGTWCVSLQPGPLVSLGLKCSNLKNWHLKKTHVKNCIITKCWTGTFYMLYSSVWPVINDSWILMCTWILMCASVYITMYTKNLVAAS